MGNLLFSPSGRISPAEFMKGAYVLIAIGAIMAVLPLISFGLSMLAIPVGLATLWCWIVLFIKRFHDGGKTGWMCLIPILAFMVLGFLISSIVTGMFAGDMQAEMEAAMTGAGESGDIGEIMRVTKEMGAGMAKKTAIPSAIAGALVSFIIAYGTNMFVKRDDHDNQYGPAS